VSDYGDFCREQRNQRFRAKVRHSHLCFQCGTTVWDTDEKCRYCGEPNLGYKQRPEKKERHEIPAS
jgi:ribosomal protein L40E